MVVKRPNLGTNSGRAVAVVNGSAANGALIQAVRFFPAHVDSMLGCELDFLQED